MKQTVRRMLCVLLCIVMILGLAACGSTGTSKAEETPAPDYVYTSTFKQLEEGSDSLYVQAADDNGFYCTTTEVISSEIPEGVTPEYEGQYDVYGTRLYYVTWDGTKTRLDNYSDMDYTQTHEDSDCNSYISNLTVGPDGNIYTVSEVYESWSDAPEGTEKYSSDWYNYYNSTDRYYLRSLDSTGAELGCVEIGLEEGDYISDIEAGSDGCLYLSASTGTYVYNKDGSVKNVVPCYGWVDSLVVLPDGRVGAVDYVDSYELCIIDSDDGCYSEEHRLPNEAYYLYTGSGDYDVYYTSGSNFYGYDLETETASKLFNWISEDINPNDCGAIFTNKDGAICTTVNEWNEDYTVCTPSLATITKEPYDPSTEKTVLTLATCWLGDTTTKRVIKFNRSSDKYRIEVKDYSEYNTEDDYSAGQTKLYTEILAGNVPDIIDLSSVSYTSLAEKGILADLYPFIDSDSELSRDDFFQNILQTMEVDGKLCCTVTGFSIETCIGAASVVGETQGWNYEQFSEALASMPEGCDAFDYYTTRYDILSTCLSMDMDSFVNTATGECSFDSQQFVDLLEFCAQFPESFDWDTYEYTDGDDTSTRISQGKQMLMNTYLTSFDDVPYYSMYFGGNATFIGYPTENGIGSMLHLNSDAQFGISAKSEYQEVAWEFLRYFLTEDYQDTIYEFPARIDSYEKEVQEAMTPEYEKDENGNYVLDENGNRIEVAKMTFWLGDNNIVDIYATTQEEADAVRQLIESTTKLAGADEEIYSIVSEQAEAFFQGQKSAEDVAKLIQSKVSIYVNEQL